MTSQATWTQAPSGPRFLEEALADSQGEMDEEKREATARGKPRLSDEAKDRLR